MKETPARTILPPKKPIVSTNEKMISGKDSKSRTAHIATVSSFNNNQRVCIYLFL